MRDASNACKGGRYLELAVAALRLHRDELLDEERVAIGCLGDPLATPREIAELDHERRAFVPEALRA